MLLVNADLTEQPMPTYGFNSGSNGDFNASFFKTIGNTLISTMVLNAIYPCIDFMMYWGMRAGFRILDRPCCSLNKQETKETSIQKYINLYSGPAYMMHYKYSTILNVCFVTFMFGFGLPYLFPVAILAFIVLYFSEKTMLYYSYRVPPMYDAKTSEMVYGMLQFAPIFYLAFGYWMCSSKQLLSNDNLTPFESLGSTPITEHLFPSVVDASGW